MEQKFRPARSEITAEFKYQQQQNTISHWNDLNWL